MNYTITELAQLAGVSTRTLRYYDVFGLLKPIGVKSGGMRLYGPAEVDKLQQVLFYRELGVALSDIKRIVGSPQFDADAALSSHREELILRRDRLDRLIDTVEDVLRTRKGELIMKDEDKFKALKKQDLEDNERKYGKEVRDRYGDAVVADANAKYAGMNPEAYAKMQSMSSEIIRLLLQAMDEGDVKGETAKRLVRLHKDWLMIFWTEYSPEAHKNLGDAYVEDERFRAFYDKYRPGAAAFLRDAICANV